MSMCNHFPPVTLVNSLTRFIYLLPNSVMDLYCRTIIIKSFWSVASSGAPFGLQFSSLCTNSLTIQWTPASSGFNASSYNISVTSRTTVGTWSVAGDTTMTTIGDLIDGTNYTVSVTAINCAGSSNSNSVSVQTCEWCVCVCVYVCV